jgi:hypothetical protein
MFFIKIFEANIGRSASLVCTRGCFFENTEGVHCPIFAESKRYFNTEYQKNDVSYSAWALWILQLLRLLIKKHLASLIKKLTFDTQIFNILLL